MELEGFEHIGFGISYFVRDAAGGSGGKFSFQNVVHDLFYLFRVIAECTHVCQEEQESDFVCDLGKFRVILNGFANGFLVFVLIGYVLE